MLHVLFGATPDAPRIHFKFRFLRVVFPSLFITPVWLGVASERPTWRGLQGHRTVGRSNTLVPSRPVVRFSDVLCKKYRLNMTQWSIYINLSHILQILYMQVHPVPNMACKMHTKKCPSFPPAMCSSLSVRLVGLPLSALSVKGAVVAPLPAWFQDLNPC